VGGKGAVDDGSLPQKFVVDYVRVCQRVEAEKQTEGSRGKSKESPESLKPAAARSSTDLALECRESS